MIAYVTVGAGHEATEELREELIQHVRAHIGAIAKPDLIQWAPNLPKTRSGKIMRRVLRKIAANDDFLYIEGKKKRATDVARF